MLLHQDKVVFKEIVSEVSRTLGYREDQVEKDYFVSLFFKRLMNKSDLPIIFKGGTSLSKVYHLIDRFSEDLDIAVLFDGRRLGDGKRKKLKYQIIEVAEDLLMNVVNIDGIESDRDYNFYEISYDYYFEQRKTLLPFLLVETILAYRPYPCEEKDVYNYITRYLMDTDRVDVIKKYELEPFKAIVQSLERTLIDKLFAICDYHLYGKYDRYSRHIYDIHKIWTSVQINKDIIKELVVPIAKDRQLFGIKNISCNPGMSPNNILVEIIENQAYENDYNEVTADFIVQYVSYDTCINSLREITTMNFFPDSIEKYE